MPAAEVNLDGLVGPTYNFGGLSWRNLASAASQMQAANPREAALQGLRKMQFLASRGVYQVVLPPHERPNLLALRQLGFEGSDEFVIESVSRICLHLLLRHCSASAMWTANAATVAPSVDTLDGRIHITPANLALQYHRSLEADFTSQILRLLFRDPNLFCHHPPLPSHPDFGDEGAANHCRFSHGHGLPGCHLFVYGFSADDARLHRPKRFPARQSLEACQALARRHRLPSERVLLAQQNPAVIDAGAFHNDVVAVANESFFFLHEEAFNQQRAVIDELRRRMDGDLHIMQVSSKELPLSAAVQSYIFNSQVVTLPTGGMIMLSPKEAGEVPEASSILSRLQDGDSPILSIETFDLRQSMRNGGGPACLRLRVVLSEAELAAMSRSCLLNDELYRLLVAWVEKHYRTSIYPQDLADPLLLRESREALDELTQILKLGSIYAFQQ